ncbi:MAG: hypothetical protein LBK26_01110 [Rickettsiales bacterium]|jgi:hypothetical protein|nr:hypothetical protein [Rickettsiales bacterium]
MGQIVNIYEIDKTACGITNNCKLVAIHVKINDLRGLVDSMVKTISDTSWLKNMDAVDAASYKARANPTIDELTDNVFKLVNDEITSKIGEYAISMSAQQALKNGLEHIAIPLAELWKEKIKGNPGFDFHTLTTSDLIAFGEAKYNVNENAYYDAILQVEDFLKNKKDVMELTDLRRFEISETAVLAANMGTRAISIAFLLIAKNSNTVFKNAVNKLKESSLLSNPEVFVIGVEL